MVVAVLYFIFLFSAKSLMRSLTQARPLDLFSKIRQQSVCTHVHSFIKRSTQRTVVPSLNCVVIKQTSSLLKALSRWPIQELLSSKQVLASMMLQIILGMFNQSQLAWILKSSCSPWGTIHLNPKCWLVTVHLIVFTEPNPTAMFWFHFCKRAPWWAELNILRTTQGESETIT